MKSNLLLLVPLATSMLAGCGGMGAYKNQSDAQLPATLQEFNGKYAVVDSRGADSKGIKEIELILSPDGRGTALAYTDEGKVRTKAELRKCNFANQAQTENRGAPVEAVDNIVICDILSSSYQYATLYVAKVKSNYVVKDQAVLSTYEPMQITAGHLITIKLSPGTGILANSSKK